MKSKYWLIPLLLLTILTACKKNHDHTSPQGLEGKWLLVKAQGGFSGKEQEIKDRQEIIFENGIYKIFVNGLQLRSAPYQLEFVDTPDGKAWKLSMDNGISPFVTINDDRLLITDDFPDGMTLTYIREK